MFLFLNFNHDSTCPKFSSSSVKYKIVFIYQELNRIYWMNI